MIHPKTNFVQEYHSQNIKDAGRGKDAGGHTNTQAFSFDNWFVYRSYLLTGNFYKQAVSDTQARTEYDGLILPEYCHLMHDSREWHSYNHVNDLLMKLSRDDNASGL